MARIENGLSADAVSIHTVGSQFDEESSFGSDSEMNGFAYERQTDKYGFIGGAQKYSTENAQDVPPEVLRARELKWLDMLKHWDKWLFKRHKKVRLRCQKGIPPSLRGRAWLYLCGGKVKREQNKGKFKELDSMPGDPKWLDVIERDLHRQFPFHEMFVSRGGHGQQDLQRVLKAYTVYRPDEGYCQAQAPIAAVLLMHMPAEDAFWCLVQICERYLPGYYSTGLEAIQLDGEILYALLKRVSTVAYRHLDKHKIEPILYMTEWFMCAFSRTLPWASVLRVWDMFLCDGVKIIFRVGLVILRCMLGSKEKLKACQGQYETMELLKTIDPRYLQEAFLVHQVLELPVSVRDVEREHHAQVKRWRKRHGELSYKSPPRIHGALAVMAAEPHSRQDLYQNPTIIVQSPLDAPGPNGTPPLNRKKRGTLRGKTPKPIPDVPTNPYALPSDPRAASATTTTTTTTATATSATVPSPDTEGSTDGSQAGNATPSLGLLTASNTPTPTPSPTTTPTAIRSRSSSPSPSSSSSSAQPNQSHHSAAHPPMFYLPPPQQPISTQPSPLPERINSQHSTPHSSPPQQHQQQQQQANGQPSVPQQPIANQTPPASQPITSQPQRQHPPMFYQPPPPQQQQTTESPPEQPEPQTPPQPTPPPPSTEPPPPPLTPPEQPITECLPQQEPISQPEPDPPAPGPPAPSSPSPLPPPPPPASADIPPPQLTSDPAPPSSSGGGDVAAVEPLTAAELLRLLAPPRPPSDLPAPEAPEAPVAAPDLTDCPVPVPPEVTPAPLPAPLPISIPEPLPEPLPPVVESPVDCPPPPSSLSSPSPTPVLPPPIAFSSSSSSSSTPLPPSDLPPPPAASDIDPEPQPQPESQAETSLHASSESVESEDTYL
ncbi:uncharacterized protein LOC134446199 [Engraulis encrasicolus]|uniref:uncharacterized protein LOC134446199 n=1 Tax=Engraulis encrasicolus TaxID=184585 RepID=UPI002FCE9006